MSTPEERFTKWAYDTYGDRWKDHPFRTDLKMAYLAATEDAARIAEEMYDRELPELHHVEIAVSDEIAAAIRGGVNENNNRHAYSKTRV